MHDHDKAKSAEWLRSLIRAIERGEVDLPEAQGVLRVIRGTLDRYESDAADGREPVSRLTVRYPRASDRLARESAGRRA